MKKRAKQIITLLIITFISISALSSAYSYHRFGTTNYIKAGISVMTVNAGVKDYCIVRDNPTVMVTKSNEETTLIFTKYFADNGYTLSDRMGSVFILEKDGKMHFVHTAGNRFFTTYIWDAEPVISDNNDENTN